MLLSELYAPPPPPPVPGLMPPLAPPPITSILLVFDQSEGTVQLPAPTVVRKMTGTYGTWNQTSPSTPPDGAEVEIVRLRPMIEPAAACETSCCVTPLMRAKSAVVSSQMSPL